MDLNTILLLVAICLFGGVGGYLFIKYLKDEPRTSEVIYTIDQVLSILYAIASATFPEDNSKVSMIYDSLKTTLELAKSLKDDDRLDKEMLKTFLLDIIRDWNIEVTDRERAVVISGIELIYVFVSK
jgi:uncharacterized protein YneF (UPF0154 family)